MKKIIKRILKLIIILIFVIFVINGFRLLNLNDDINLGIDEKIKEIPLIKSEDISEDISSDGFIAKVKFSGYIVDSLLIDDINYLFVPRNLDISDLKIKYNADIKMVSSGELNLDSKTIVNDFSKDAEIILTTQDDIQYKIKVMQSDVPSLCINLEDVTLEEVNNGSKDVKYQANLQVVGADEEKYNINKIIELKGRGNSTWTLDKKPYQIKFEDEQNLLGINGKAKKWILLANYADKTLLKNQLTFDLQKKIGLSDSLNGTFVDLYINGEFLGNYNLCDKVDIEEKRVNLKDPKGVVAEMDFAFGNMENNSFRTKTTGTIFVIKESVSDEDTKEYAEGVADFEKSINELESLMYTESPNWDEISKLIDVDSFLKYYFLIELAEDPDRFMTSTFFYKDGVDDVIHIGPIWDSDLAFGHFRGNGVDEYVDYTLNMNRYRGSYKHDYYTELYRNKEFVRLLNEMYEETISPVFNSSSTIIDDYISNMPKSIEMNLLRWHSNMNMERYSNKVKDLKYFIELRTQYLDERYSTNIVVIYNSFIRNNNTIEDTWPISEAWEENWKKDGETSGIITKPDIEMENIKITLANSKDEQNIRYDVHISGKDWLGWKYNGNEFENVDDGNIDAIKIELENMSEYQVMYRVYINNKGWQDWKYDGDIAGEINEESLIQGIEIKIEKK